MSNWYEVYDSDVVLLATRKRFAKLCITSAVATVLTLALLVYLLARPEPYVFMSLGTVSVWLGFGLWAIRRFHKLRRVVWCIKVSDRRVEGYNFARRRIYMDWTRIRRIDLTSNSIQVVGQFGQILDARHRFPDFTELSHRLVAHAEFYDVPVYIEGRPWQEVDVHDLYPYIEGDEPSHV